MLSPPPTLGCDTGYFFQGTLNKKLQQFINKKIYTIMYLTPKTIPDIYGAKQAASPIRRRPMHIMSLVAKILSYISQIMENKRKIATLKISHLYKQTSKYVFTKHCQLNRVILSKLRCIMGRWPEIYTASHGGTLKNQYFSPLVCIKNRYKLS